MRTVKQDPRSRVLGALHTHAWLPIIALHAGMEPSKALEVLMQLKQEGRVYRYTPELWGRESFR